MFLGTNSKQWWEYPYESKHVKIMDGQKVNYTPYVLKKREGMKQN